MMNKIFVCLSCFFTLSYCADFGWIFKQAIPSNNQLVRIISYDKNSLIVQTNEGIYTAPFDNPNKIQQNIVKEQKQIVPLDVNPFHHSLIYVGGQYIKYQEANSNQMKSIPQMKYASNVIKFQNFIFFYNPVASPHLLAYNQNTDKIQQGPLLNSEVNGNSVMGISYQLKVLFVSVGKIMNVVDLTKMVVTQSIENYCEISSIHLSQTGKYLKLYSMNSQIKLSSLWRWDKDIMQYIRIITTSNTVQDYNKQGYKINQTSDNCSLFSINLVNAIEYIHNSKELDCSQPYSKVTGRLEKNRSNSIHQIGQNFRDVYSLSDTLSEKQSYLLTKNTIQQNKLVLKWIKPINITFSLMGQWNLLKITKDQLVILKPNTQMNQLLLLDINNNSFLCFQEIKQKIKIPSNSINYVNFDPSESIVFLIFSNDPLTLVWINTDNCQIQSATFQHNIYEVWFMKSKFYLNLYADSYFYVQQFDIKQKILINQKFFIDSDHNVLFHDNIYGIIFYDPVFAIVKYSETFQIEKQNLIPCNVDGITIEVGQNHLSVKCNNFYHLFNQDLQYLESTAIQLTLLSRNDMTETFSSSLRFSRLTGELHQSSFKKWSSRQVQAQWSAQTNYYFYNQTDFVFISMFKNLLYLNYVTTKGLDFHLVRQIPLYLNASHSLMTPNPLKWSCSKEQILLQYNEFQDKQITYINVYETSTFRLLYSHRAQQYLNSVKIVGSFQFVAQLDCDNNLFVSHLGWLEKVQLNKRKALFSNLIVSVDQLALSGDTKTGVVFGSVYSGTKSIEIWDLNTSTRKSYYSLVKNNVSSQIFFINNIFLLLDAGKLYNNLTQIRENISDCSYFDQKTLICIDFNGSFMFFPDNNVQSKNSLSQPYSKIAFSLNRDILINYNSSTLWIFNTKDKKFDLNQTITFKNFTIDSLELSSDSKSLICYSKQQKIFSLLSTGRCPLRSTLENGICICEFGFVDSSGGCLCSSGMFADGESCSECSLFCSQCEGSAGNCLKFSSGGIIIIISSGIILIAAALLFYRCFRRRKEKKNLKSVGPDSELTTQYSSIND